MPIYESGLDPLVISNLHEGRLRFTDSLSGAITDSNVYRREIWPQIQLVPLQWLNKENTKYPGFNQTFIGIMGDPNP